MKNSLKIFRDTNGIPHVDAENLTDMYWGNGYVHAKDRGMQMLLMRILGQGRVSEILDWKYVFKRKNKSKKNDKTDS